MRNRCNKYHYKSSNLASLDEIEYMLFEAVNEYGYNLGSEKRQIKNIEKLLTTPKKNYNKDYFNNLK